MLRTNPTKEEQFPFLIIFLNFHPELESFSTSVQLSLWLALATFWTKRVFMHKALSVMFNFLVPFQTHSQGSDLVTQGTSALKSVPTVKRNLNLGTVSFFILFVRAIIVLDLGRWFSTGSDPCPSHTFTLSHGVGILVCDHLSLNNLKWVTLCHIVVVLLRLWFCSVQTDWVSDVCRRYWVLQLMNGSWFVQPIRVPVDSNGQRLCPTPKSTRGTPKARPSSLSFSSPGGHHNLRYQSVTSTFQPLETIQSPEATNTQASSIYSSFVYLWMQGARPWALSCNGEVGVGWVPTIADGMATSIYYWMQWSGHWEDHD